MGGRGASSKKINEAKIEKEYKDRKNQIYDRWYKDRNKITKKEKERRIEYMANGVIIREARIKAREDFEKEYERVDNILDEEWGKATKEYKRKLGMKY